MSDAVNRAIDLSEEYDTMMEVQRNPAGAWMAIQELAGIISALPAVQPAHVNETQKGEHDARDVLTPATKGAAHD